MNRDCLLSIAEFASPKQLMQLTSEFTGKYFPSSVTIQGHKQLEEFYEWARHFDTSNLTEVRIMIKDDKLVESIRTDFPKAARADGLVVPSTIGLVPPSVKKLTLCVWTYEPVRIPDTVEDVVIEDFIYDRGIGLPDSVRSLHLSKEFSGVVLRWPQNLERLEMLGWTTGNGRWPVPIETIPNSVKHLTLGSYLDIEIVWWPESLEEVVFIGDPAEFGWSLDNAGIPDWVNVTVIPIPPEPVINWDDDYEDPMVEMWNL